MSLVIYDYLQLVQTALAVIRTSNGYLTDLGANVLLEDTQQLDDEGARLVVLQDTLTRPQDPAVRGGGRVRFVVVAQHPRGPADAQMRLHRAQADVIRCLTDTNALRPIFQPGGVPYPFPQFEESIFASQVDGLAWIGVAVRFTAHLRFPR